MATKINANLQAPTCGLTDVAARRQKMSREPLVLFDMEYFIYCIFKRKHQAGKGSRSGSRNSPHPPPPPARFPPSTRRLINSRWLFCSFSHLWTFLCSGCNCVWATSARRTHAGVSLARLKVKGSSGEAQWGHWDDFSVWKTGPVFMGSNLISSLLGGPL